ncbi:MAG: hypothetical protein GXP27_19635 [Planctomycetes bacterium]|nr:hypothetical protein [Planctomycetota bacterium]
MAGGTAAYHVLRNVFWRLWQPISENTTAKTASTPKKLRNGIRFMATAEEKEHENKRNQPPEDTFEQGMKTPSP